MNITKGVVLLTRKSPPCPNCPRLKRRLDGAGIKYRELDVNIVAKVYPIYRRSTVPRVLLNGTEVLSGDSDTYTKAYLKKLLEV